MLPTVLMMEIVNFQRLK